MAPTFRPSDRFVLCLAGVEHAVGVVFDNVAGDRGMRLAALGARFDVNLGHLFCSPRCVCLLPRGWTGGITFPGGTDRFVDGERVFLYRLNLPQRTKTASGIAPRWSSRQVGDLVPAAANASWVGPTRSRSASVKQDPHAIRPVRTPTTPCPSSGDSRNRARWPIRLSKVKPQVRGRGMTRTWGGPPIPRALAQRSWG
jgi:hypothetical protein